MERAVLLTCFGFLTVIGSVTVTVYSETNHPPDAECRPTGTHLSDNTSGACAYAQDNGDLRKDSHWSINWPDGHFDGLTAKGNGACTWNSDCSTILGYTYCWPSFYAPVTTSTGDFGIFVENKMWERVWKECAFPLINYAAVYCNTTSQTVFQKSHTCSWGDEGCQEQGQPCSSTSDCCSGVCGENSGTCIPCEIDTNNPSHGCMSEACISCYNGEGVYCDPWTSACYTPLIVDVDGDGFDLTNLNNGVRYDAFGQGGTIQSSWTSVNSDDAWLVLDRNGNGQIDNGTEMFSSVAPQPQVQLPDLRNGFNALVQYDKPENGGNSDGVLNMDDVIFDSLKLWQDTNHNGIGEPSELKTLPERGLRSIDMDYKEAKKQDGHGNRFKYRAKLKDQTGAQLGRWIYDVYLLARP